MKQLIISFFVYLGLLCALCLLLSSCHALVVADKLYYQGSIAKQLPDKVEVTDSTFTSVNE